MKRSKLEDYLAIVTVLIVHGPLEAEKLKTLCGIAEENIGEDLSFLVKQKIVEENRSAFLTYAASPHGIRLVKYFGSMPKTRLA